MARKRTRKSTPSRSKSAPLSPLSIVGWLVGSRWGRRAVVGFNVVLLLLGSGWYLAQPAGRKAEIRQLVGAYMDREKRVRFTELAWDLWQYYYGDQFVASNFDGGDDPVYGGEPDASGTGSKVRVLRNSGYVVGYSDAMRNPLWVSYRLFAQAETTKPGERPEGFDIDDRTFAKVRSSDYTGSGYDRGHMAPNYGIALCYGREAQEETFLMSNIVPQTHELNAGPWKELEMRAAVNYPARCQEIWVFAGPVFTPAPRKTAGGVPVPESCYKIMLDETEGRLRAQAFLMPQTLPAGSNPGNFLVSIDEIEKRTGIDFLPALEDEAETALEARVASSIW